jgi:hypothetical protein
METIPGKILWVIGKEEEAFFMYYPTKTISS